MAGMIESLNIIAIFIALCAVVLAGMVFRRQLKKIGYFFLNGIIGLTAIFVINFATAPFGLSVGVNITNALFIGILGIPGLLTLYAATWVL